MTLAVRQHHAHLDLVVALVEDLRQFAVERGAQLPADVLDAQSQGLAQRAQAEDQLLLPERHVVLDRLDTRDRRRVSDSSSAACLSTSASGRSGGPRDRARDARRSAR